MIKPVQVKYHLKFTISIYLITQTKVHNYTYSRCQRLQKNNKQIDWAHLYTAYLDQKFLTATKEILLKPYVGRLSLSQRI